MSTLAGKTRLMLEPKMAVAMDAVAVTETHESLTVSLGPLSQLRYKPANWSYLLRLSAAPTTGNVTFSLMAAGSVIRSESVALNGVTAVGNTSAVDLSNVSGETQLIMRVDVTSAADGGITGTVDSLIDVDQPVILSGC
jgi:hypothetical protein